MFLSAGGNLKWHQVASAAPYEFDGIYRIYVSSPVLPPSCTVDDPAGLPDDGASPRIAFGLGLDGRVERAPSGEEVDHTINPHSFVTMGADGLAPFIGFRCGLSPEAARTIARKLIVARSTWRMTARLYRLRSVSEFRLMASGMEIFDN